DPQPVAAGASTPLEGIRALGMGHVIAGAGIGRDLASFGADVLNLWRPGDSEIEPFYWDTAVGMRSAYLSDTGTDRLKLDELLHGADVFFSNRHPGYLEQAGLTADHLAAHHRGLVHAQVLLHGAEGPWATRPGFDEIGACALAADTYPSRDSIQTVLHGVIRERFEMFRAEPSRPSFKDHLSLHDLARRTVNSRRSKNSSFWAQSASPGVQRVSGSIRKPSSPNFFERQVALCEAPALRRRGGG